MSAKKITEEIKKLRKKVKEKEGFLKKQKSITKQAVKNLKSETKKHVVTAIVAAFGFIIALVWRDAIKEFIETLVINLSINGPSSLITFYTALITTVIAVIGIIIITKWGSKPEE